MPITPASIRHKNPGAMNVAASGWQKPYGLTGGEVLNDGIKHQVNRIASFETEIGGAAAQFALLYRFAGKHGKRLDKVIATWSGANSVPSYLKIIKRRVGLTGEHILTRDQIKDPEFAIDLAQAMAWHEAGQEFPLDDAGWQEAHAWFLREVGAPAAPVPGPEKSITQIAAESRTVKTGATGLATTAAIAAPEAVTEPTPLEALKETGTLATEIKQPLTSIDALLQVFLSNPWRIGVIVLAGTVGYMVFRRIKDTKEGRHV